MFFLGIDLGTSAVKATLINADNGHTVASAAYPKCEATIESPEPGWAEQDPKVWWANTQLAVQAVMLSALIDPTAVRGVGIAYQMHGLVLVDKQHKPLRPAIIWCDSRAVELGDQAFRAIGKEKCLTRLLNSPGNFTAAKLKWVKDNEPHIFERIDKIMLPGDFIAMKLTGIAATTIPGLTEGVFWDFQNNTLSEDVVNYFDFPGHIFPKVVPTFGIQGELPSQVAQSLGLAPGTPVAYRAGDQPNNAFSLNVLKPGEVAATAGTSGVIYGIVDHHLCDPESRVNTFAHVNHRHHHNESRLGVLLCINGAGSANRWIKDHISFADMAYEQLNEQAGAIPLGAAGLAVLPFGNGAERVLGNRELGCIIGQLDFNRHSRAHLYRAVQEGVAFSLNYGLKVLQSLGLKPTVIRAGRTNMFQSPVFCEIFSGTTGIPLELYDTDGAKGAALGASVGAGYFSDFKEAFARIKVIDTVEPSKKDAVACQAAYARWEAFLKAQMA